MSMKSLLMCFLGVLSVVSGIGQNTIGLPDVVNYSKKIYGGGLQNWDFSQDSSGIIYVANNEGLLSFDGRYWNLHPLPNKTITRSVLASDKQRIYVGGQDELGYFFPDSSGRLRYESLLARIAPADRTFGDIWDIVQVKQDIWFRSAKRIFKFSGTAIAVYPASSEWGFLSTAGGRLFAQDFEKGLMTFDNGAWRILFPVNLIPAGDVITGIHALTNGQWMIACLKSGLFISDGEELKPMQHKDLVSIHSGRIYCTAQLADGRFGLATNTDGLYIIDQTGKKIQHFGRREGLQNNNILSVRADRNNNLWLGLDNGIDFIAYNSAIKRIDPTEGNATAYTTLIQNNVLYIGTSNGTWMTNLDETADLSFSQRPFQNIENTNGQAWSLTEINNQILLGHHEGLFRIQSGAATPIQTGLGFWNCKPISSNYPTERILAGNYKGLQFFDFKGERFVSGETLHPFEESSRYVVIDGEKNIWVSHPYHGVFRLNNRTDNNIQSWKSYGDTHGLPSRMKNHIFKIRDGSPWVSP